MGSSFHRQEFDDFVESASSNHNPARLQLVANGTLACGSCDPRLLPIAGPHHHIFG
jgi:hypothetical protein